MGRYRIETKPAPAVFAYPGRFQKDETDLYVKYGHRVFAGTSERGDPYWTAEIITQTWFQAETGRVPISGAGYGGPFSGEGFDGMWLDMSEIVRPTRDGIHGREYISTAVDIGRKLPYLSFNGAPPTAMPPLVSIPMPLILDLCSPTRKLPPLDEIIEHTAVATDLIAILDSKHRPAKEEHLHHIAFYLGPDSPPLPDEVLQKTRLVEISDAPNVTERIQRIKRIHPGIVVSIRVELTPAAVERVLQLARMKQVEVVHVVADENGNERGTPQPKFIKDVLRQIHCGLIEQGIRDEITLMAGGGVALPEHMAKAIICGADVITVNLPLLVAMECQLCERCEPGMLCPAQLEKIDLQYGVGRMTNLVAAWHDQLIEVMGAMGMREVRRLRGDVGRAMFFENLEEETFGKLYGTRKRA